MSVTMMGKPISLQGNRLKVGDNFPEFTLTDINLGRVSSQQLKGKRVFLTVPSLDTGVCDMEVRNFNKKAGEIKDVQIYAVSMDLPFAQSRWCGGAGVKNVTTLSDYQTHNFGKATGTLIEGLELLTRAVFVVDEKNIIKYVEYVAEVTNHPDYDAVYKILEN